MVWSAWQPTRPISGRSELHDSDIAGPLLLAQDFDVTYHWVQ